MIFALMVIVLCAFIGGAIDFARFFHAKALYTDGIDRAALAAVRIKQLGGSDSEALAAADDFMAPIRQRMPYAGTVEFKVADDGVAIEGLARLQVPTTFLRVIKFDELPFTAVNTARFSIGSNVEIALMLDTTGSMDGQKIQDLKDAVEDLVNIVIQDDSNSYKARIAVAPFAASVKLKSDQFQIATGKKKSGMYRGCVVERSGMSAYTDDAPGAGSYLIALDDINENASCKDHEVQPLSNKKSDIKNMVKSLGAGGSTAGHLGTAWAWYLLSPQWSAMMDQSEIPAPYSELQEKLPSGEPKLRKIAVLMTDGEYNTQYTATDSTTQARSVCAEMKKSGIEVFSIGFDVAGSQTVLDTLQGCASSPSNFYNATDGAALKAAFRDIALKSSPIRLSR
jgi:Flp pilus assembly protein TadG